MGIRFVLDNASGSSQEIHGRGAEINVLSHLHTSRPHGPHILPVRRGGVRSSAQDSIRSCLPSPSFPPFYLSIVPPSPRSFRWIMYLVDRIIADSNIGQTYTGTGSENDDNIRGQMRCSECQSSFLRCFTREIIYRGEPVRSTSEKHFLTKS